MAKFEIGDKVKIASCSNDEYLGKVGVVKNRFLSTCGVFVPKYDVKFAEVGYIITLSEEQLEKVESVEMSDYEKRFFAITDEMRETFLKKNRDYGNSFSETIQKFGVNVAVARIHDKYMRLENMVLGKQMNVNESMRDTLLDMANYCILTLIELEPRKEKE